MVDEASSSQLVLTWILHLVRFDGILGGFLGHQCLNGIHGGIGATGFSKQDLTLSIHGKDPSRSSLGGFLKSNGVNQSGLGVAQKGVG